MYVDHNECIYTSSTTAEKTINDETNEQNDRSIHSSKTTLENEVKIETANIIDYKIDKEMNSSSDSTIERSEQASNDYHQETIDQRTRMKRTNVIGTGSSYIGGGIKNTFHGVSYQMELSMIYIVRGLKQKRKFEVAIEVKDAGKLDDLVFLCENEVGFLQAKHKLNENVVINDDHLLSIEGDFSIVKYFQSYLQISSQEELGHILKDRDMTLILNTNICIDNFALISFDDVTASLRLSGNKILALGTNMDGAKYYVIKKYSALYQKLEDNLLSKWEPPLRAAENLAKAVVNNKKSINTKSNESFETHREWLLYNVFEVGMEEIKTQKKYFVKFKDSFLSGSEQSASVFRKTFFKTYLSNKQIGKKATTNANNTFDEHTVKQDLLGIKFLISRDFTNPKSTYKTSTNKTAIDKPEAVRKFLDVIVFAVSQPNDIELGYIIEKEIGDYVGHSHSKTIASKFKLYIQDWVKQKDGRFLTNEDVERQFAVWSQETLNQTRLDEIKKYKCTFKESNNIVQNISNFLNTENDVNVLCLYSRETLLTKIKVCQALERFASENVDQQFMFCDINDLIKLENSEMCPVKAFSSQTCNILFLSLPERKLHNAEVKILHRLLEIIAKINRNDTVRSVKNNENDTAKDKQRKRIIISISEQEKCAFVNQSGFENLGVEYTSVDDLVHSFIDLDEKSRRQLAEEDRIKLHGKSIKGIISDSNFYLYIRDEMLLQLITSKLEINDTFEANNYYSEEVSKYYMNRSLVPIMVRQDITKDTRFHVLREDAQHTDIKNQEIVVISSNEMLFNKFCETNTDVHWFKETKNNFLWITSQGTVSNLREYIVQNDEYENCVLITNVNDLKNNVVLISAIPGMGKSILLSHIAYQSENEDTVFFVFKTNLVDYCTQLCNLDEEHITLMHAIHFVFFATQVESRQIEKNESALNLFTIQEDGSVAFTPNASFGNLVHLRAMVFCYLYNTNKIVLLLDGLDEIAPDYCKTTLNLLQTLKRSKIRKMWVTTRPYNIIEKLEKCLETFAYVLKPLSKDNQKAFIKSYSRHNIKSQDTGILEYLNKIFDSSDMSTFLGVPLHSYMLAKLLTNDFLKFRSQSAVPSILTEGPFSIFNLYSRFFNIKFDEILYYNVNLKDPKNSLYREKKEQVVTDHGKMALLEIFDKDLLTGLVSDEDMTELNEFIKSGKEKTGIVAEVVDNKPRFIHRTFAEYFAGVYLALLILSPVENKSKEAAKSLLYNSVTLNSGQYNVLFTFFNYRVVSSSENKDVFEAAISGNTLKLLESPNITEMYDSLNRTPIHLMLLNYLNIVENYPYAFPYRDLRGLPEDILYYLYLNTVHLTFRIEKELVTTCSSSDTLFNWTPTHYLMICPIDKLPFKRFILKPGVLNYVSQDTHGRTPLMLLILSDSYNNMSLFERTQCINIQDHSLKTALHHVLERVHKCTAVLTASHFNYYVHHTDEMKSLEHGLIRISCLLRYGAGAFISIPDIQGNKPVHIINLVITRQTKYKIKMLLLHVRSEAYKFRMSSLDQFIDLYDYTIKYMDNLRNNAISFDIDSINKLDDMGRTALHNAVERHDYNAVEYLCNNGARPDIADREGKRPGTIDIEQLSADIHEPVIQKSVSTLWFIDELPPKIAKLLVRNTDLLTLSTDNSAHKDVIIFILFTTKIISQVLLSKCPHFVDVVDSAGRTALHYAVQIRNKQSVITLIENNARVNILDNESKMPVHIRKSEILHVMHAKQGIHNDFKLNDLVTLEFIDSLPRVIANPLVLTMNLYPLLTQIDADFIVFVLNHAQNIASVLLSHYPDAVNTTDSKGRTALHHAVAMQRGNVIRYLIRKNARVDICDNDGKYPAHLEKISELPYSESIEEIESHKELQKANDVRNENMLSFINSLPNHIAIIFVHTMPLIIDYLPFIQRRGLGQLILELLRGRCNLSRNPFQTPFCSLNEMINDFVCVLLQSNYIEDFSESAVKSNDIPKYVVELFDSVKNNDLSRVQKVLRSVEYSLVKPNFGNVNLHLDLNMAACVVNAKSKDGGKTPLHYVAQIGNAEIAKCLLSHGASYNAPDVHGITPAQVAKTYDNKGVLYLLEKVGVLFSCLKDTSPDISQRLAEIEGIDGTIFHCTCFDAKMPLMHMVVQQKNTDLLKSFMRCYQFKTDILDCRSLEGKTIISAEKEMNICMREICAFMEFPSDLNNFIWNTEVPENYWVCTSLDDLIVRFLGHSPQFNLYVEIGRKALETIRKISH